MSLRIVVIGLSITSSWGNGHATTYRGLLRALDARGHQVTFLERDMPWYRNHRDSPDPPFAETHLYGSVEELKERFRGTLREADAVVIGSFTPDGVEVANWAFDVAGGLVLFYDIDTPVTLAALEQGNCEYLRPSIVPKYDLYLSFTGGPVLQRLEKGFGARRAIALYCSVDPDDYPPASERSEGYDLGYLGTYSADRQPALERYLVEPAKRRPEDRFVVAGPQYPAEVQWPDNVDREDHVPPARHAAFYHDQRFTLNITRTDMVRAGYAPSVRLFEAAATASPILTDGWPGLETFFRPEEEVLVIDSTEDVLQHLEDMTDAERRRMGRRARERVLSAHTPSHRAATLEAAIETVLDRRFAHA